MTSRLGVRAGTMALLVALSVTPLAAEPRSPSVARVSLRAQSLAAPRSTRMLQQTTPVGTPAQEPPRAFWRSRRGVAVAVMMVAVTGYALYSKSNDRVKSPAS